MKDREIKGTEAWKARGPELERIANELQQHWTETRVGLIRDDGEHQISAEVHLRAEGETVVRYRLLSQNRDEGRWGEQWFDSLTGAVEDVMRAVRA